MPLLGDWLKHAWNAFSNKDSFYGLYNVKALFHKMSLDNMLQKIHGVTLNRQQIIDNHMPIVVKYTIRAIFDLIW